MLSDFRWGSFSLKKMCIEVLHNFWMVIAVMIITFLGVSLLDRFAFTPVYTSESIVAVYPFNTLYNLDSAGDTWDAVMSASSVFNSDMFSAGLEAQLGENDERSFFAAQITDTNMLKLEAESTDPADAYKTIRAALKYYGEFSVRLPEQSELEILLQPDVSFKASNKSPFSQYKILLTLFMGFAMGAVLAFLYIARPTYKTVSAFKRTYKNTRCFILSPAVKEHKYKFRKEKSRKRKTREEDLKATAVELRQFLRKEGRKSVLITAGDRADGKTEVAVSLAKELSDLGDKVVLVDGDFKHPSLVWFFDNTDYSVTDTVLGILNGKCTVEEAVKSTSEKGLQVIFAGDENLEEDFSYTCEDIKLLLDKLDKMTDVVLLIGRVWKNEEDVRIWNEAVDATLAVCGQDNADFRTMDLMMGEIRNGKSAFAGCILNGFA